ncbi:hypothetical protein I302_103724 [Kwoniella bestiolae CBS 10118]|uniref:J domain-containing protein n=1 Tax=Kwoniella bestiolae CBS 10118 TaxID=1296100 RepID=A0A1B9G960_9TREE|nr:hypothetical protein I302_02427 [Kwoniella bestiolae CBS 10118]OCF27584.1 hypothetical protein I302_02427 [Kwoniella bestiolae CBS 10118]
MLSTALIPTRTSPFRRLLSRKQVFRQTHSQMQTRSTHSYYTTLTLDDALVDQDPYRRIRFDHPLWMLDRTLESGRLAVARSFWADAHSVEPFLLPFWQVHLLCDQKSSIQWESPNGTVEAGPDFRYYSDIGMAIAAVPKDHWASGIYVPWRIKVSADKLVMLYSETEKTRGSLDLLPSETPSIYSNPQKQILDPFMPEMWNPYTAPKFAYGPPDLKGREEKIIMLQGSDEAEFYEAFVPYGIRVYAIPVYRLMYKVGLGRGFGVMDASMPMMGMNVFRHDWKHGELRTLIPYLYTRVGHHHRRWTPPDEISEPEIVNAAFKPPSKIEELVKLLFDGMWNRGAITPSMWENERILPEFGPARDGNAQLLDEYNEACLKGWNLPPEPKFPIKETQTAAPKTTLFNPRNPRSRTAETSGSTVSTKEEQAKVTRQYSGNNTQKRRTAHYRDQAHIRLNNVRRSIRMTPEEEYISKVETFLPDPKGFYKVLGIEDPPKEFLRADKKEYIDDLISIRRGQESLTHHPDRGGTVRAMASLNEAHDKLDTLEKRRQYYAESRLGYRFNR